MKNKLKKYLSITCAILAAPFFWFFRCSQVDQVTLLFFLFSAILRDGTLLLIGLFFLAIGYVYEGLMECAKAITYKKIELNILMHNTGMEIEDPGNARIFDCREVKKEPNNAAD